MLRSNRSLSFPSIYRGIVESNKDPENLGRCKIRVPSIHGELTYPIDIIPWARPVVLSPVGGGRGSVNIPEVGDIVWVLFEGSDRDFPVYLGGTYARGDINIDKNIITFYIEDSTSISYNKDKKIYTINVEGNSITVSPENISIIGNLTVSGDISISGNLSVSGTTTLNNLVITGSCNRECDCP